MFEVEKDWVTDAGFRAVVIMTDMGHRCGYVGLPKSHPLYGVDMCLILSTCSRSDFVDVHGGLTYAGGRAEYPAPSDGLWWFGYDCRHAGDAPLPGSRMSEYKCADDVHHSLDYCIAECESLARQMVTRAAPQGDPANLHGINAARVSKWGDRLDSLRQVPDGWVLVPVAPTIAMQDAASAAWQSASPSTMGFVLWEKLYRAMLAAAPKANPVPQTTSQGNVPAESLTSGAAKESEDAPAQAGAVVLSDAQCDAILDALDDCAWGYKEARVAIRYALNPASEAK